MVRGVQESYWVLPTHRRHQGIQERIVALQNSERVRAIPVRPAAAAYARQPDREVPRETESRQEETLTPTLADSDDAHHPSSYALFGAVRKQQVRVASGTQF